MPGIVVERITRILNDQRRSVRSARVLLLGATYKPDIADDRGAPLVPVAERLHRLGARVAFHDPYVERADVAGLTLRCEESLEDAVARADLVVLLQAHREYDVVTLADRAGLFFDTSGRAAGSGVTLL